MESLSKTLYTVVSNSIDEFAQILSSKYEMSKEEIIELWNEKVSAELKVTTKKPTSTRTRSKPTNNDSSESTANCTYVFKKGQHNGNQCTAKICSESTAFCRKHKEQEGKSTEKPIVTNVKKSTSSAKVKATESKEVSIPVIKKIIETSSSKGMTLRKNKFDNYEHSETKFIFDRTTKEVIGKQLDDGKVADLTIEDIEVCKKHSFKYRMPATLSGELEDDNDELEELEESELEESEEDQEEDDEE